MLCARKQYNNHGQDDDAHQQDRGTSCERTRQKTPINCGQLVHAVLDELRQPCLALLRTEEHRAHHWRQRQGGHARNDDGSRQCESKFFEQRAGQPAHQPNRGVDSRKRDRHGDNRGDDLARADQRRAHRGQPLLNMSLDILDDDDCVIDDEADSEHQGKKREQIERKSAGHHQGGRTYQ